MPFIEQVPSPSPPPPAIYDTSEHNKENILPFDFVNQFHLPNIIPKFDARFKTFEQYRNYRNQRLTSVRGHYVVRISSTYLACYHTTLPIPPRHTGYLQVDLILS